jgi:hypothetical protein
MTPLLAANTADIAFVAIPIGAALIVVMTALLTGHFRKSQRDDMEATLKMEMIQRGMSAEEIERVLAARIGESQPSGHPRPFQMQPQSGAPPTRG